MARHGTPATQAMMRAKVPYELGEYDYDHDADRAAIQAAEAMGVSPDIVFKTLMIELDGKPICAVLQADCDVDMKALAAGMGAKSAHMMKRDAAEKQTGYKVGGVSPFGQRKVVPTVLEEGALAHPQIYVNGGRRGLQACVAPEDIVRALDCKVLAFARAI